MMDTVHRMRKEGMMMMMREVMKIARKKREMLK
jgi:hypothetical protein